MDLTGEQGQGIDFQRFILSKQQVFLLFCTLDCAFHDLDLQRNISGTKVADSEGGRWSGFPTPGQCHQPKIQNLSTRLWKLTKLTLDQRTLVNLADFYLLDSEAVNQTCHRFGPPVDAVAGFNA